MAAGDLFARDDRTVPDRACGSVAPCAISVARMDASPPAGTESSQLVTTQPSNRRTRSVSVSCVPSSCCTDSPGTLFFNV